MAGTINIDNFVSNFRDIGARPNKFMINIPMGGANLSFMAKSTSGIPASTIAEIPIPYQGRKAKYAGARTFDEWTVTVINDESWDIRRAMENWMRMLQGHDQIDSLMGTAGSYKDNIGDVVQLDVSGNPIRTYRFVNIWPRELQEIEVDWEADDVESFDITFRYDYWTATGNGGTVAG
jgi:hypothetical protein